MTAWALTARGPGLAGFSFAKVSERVIAHSTAKPVELLETLLEQLAHIILTEFNTSTVTIRVSKPAAVAQALTAGVEITRTKALN